MGRRQTALSRSIQRALFRDPDTFRKTLIGRILAFFSLFYIKLIRYGHKTFRTLRNDVWQIDEAEYRASFRSEDCTHPLTPMGDMGFSGSVRILPALRPTNLSMASMASMLTAR